MWIQGIQPYINLLTLITLIITAVFVIRYWKETQIMKEAMITQNNVSTQSLKSSLLPVLDVQFETVKADPEVPPQWNVQFAYDIFIENKGNGPAFNVNVQRIVIPDKNQQKKALRPQPQSKLEQFTKKIHMIGRGEKIKVYREHSDSIEHVNIAVTYRDHFKDMHKCVFEGDRDSLKLVEYPILQVY